MGSYAKFSLFLRISHVYTVKNDHIHPPSPLLKHSPSIPAPTLAPCLSQLCVLLKIISTWMSIELSIGAGDIYQWSWSHIKSQSADLLQPLKYTQNVKGDSGKIATSPLTISWSLVSFHAVFQSTATQPAVALCWFFLRPSQGSAWLHT